MQCSLIKYIGLGLLGIGLMASSCQKGTVTPPEPQMTDIQGTVLNYLSLPDFASLDFEAKVLPDVARFLYFDTKESQVYFARKKKEGKKDLNLLCADTSLIRYARIEDGVMLLGPYSSYKLDNLLFRFPAHLLKVKDSAALQMPYKQANYNIDLEELSTYYTRRAIYDAPVLFELYEDGKRYGIANHAAVIARPGESSLTSFAEQLTASAKSDEGRYQALLDFVSEEIDYESITQYEVFFKPNEVLLRKKSDCSGKVVLYASLLEQLGLPYLLVYMEGHILVAVPGDFSHKNGMSFNLDGTDFFFAETTLEGFQIGKTQTYPLLTEKDIQFLQQAGERNRLYNYATKDSLDFMTMEVVVKE